MKTVSERKADLVAEVQREADRRSKQLERFAKYVDEIEAKNIPAFSNEQTRQSGSNYYDLARQRLRDQIREAYRNDRILDPAAFIDTACDHCKTALFDVNPMVTLTSSPPCFRVACMGCGWDGTLPMELRTYADL